MGQITDLDEAISLSRKVLEPETTPIGSPNRAGYLNNLAIRLIDRYEESADPEDLAGALAASSEALILPATKKRDYAMYLDSSGSILQAKFERFRRPDDLKQAVEASQNAVKYVIDGANRPLTSAGSAVDYFAATRILVQKKI